MKPSLAHLSPTVPAAFATAVAISLSGFLLAGAGVQGEPAPLLPAIGSAAGRVIADLPPAAKKRAPEPVRSTATTGSATTHASAAVPQRRSPLPQAHHSAHRPRPARVIHIAAPVRVHPPKPAPPATPVSARPSPLPKAPAAKGKALGHSRSHGHGQSHGRAHAPKPVPATGVRAQGHGKAVGHHGGLPPGQAKKAPAAQQPAAAAPPKAHGGGPPADHGGGNGHDGGKR